MYFYLIPIALYVLERSFPARRQPDVKRWRLRALLFMAAGIPVIELGRLTWIPWFQQHAVMHELRTLPPVLAGLLAFVVFQFFLYWWHRAKHESDLLWRVLHQIHHSPRRIEVLTAYYGHPLDAVGNVMLSGCVCWFLLGLDWTGVAAFALIEAFYDFFTHSNLRTPYWIGYFVQRPEMHRVHHEYGVHKNNYALPIWDMLFGTHVNPRPHQDIAQCGFDAEREMRVVDMLLLRDVHATPIQAEAAAAASAAPPSVTSTTTS